MAAHFKKIGLYDGGGSEWDESEHPRGQPDNAGQFASKGGSGKDKEFSSLLSAKRVAEKIPEKALEASGNKAIQSKVFDKISMVRKRLEKCGEAIISVYSSTNKYTVRLYGPNKDYDYDIIDIEEID